MSSPYPLVTRPPLLSDENPLVLTIRGAESVDAFGDRAGNSAVGANAGKFGYGSTGILEYGLRGERLQFRYGENVENHISRKVESAAFGAATSGFETAGGVGAGEASHGKIAAPAAANGGGGGTGGKLRSVRRGNNKKTPYERPATGRHATAGGSASMAPVTLSGSKGAIATLKDKASRVLHSSASLLFSAIFKRQPASITANFETPTAASTASKKEEVAATLEAPAEEDNDKYDELASQVPALEDVSEKLIDRSGLGIEQVEEFLKQRTWSREQVERMTEIMNSRVSENDPACPVSEAEKLEDQLRINAKVSSPVQVARAYMGDQLARPSGIAASVRKSAFLSFEVQPSPARAPLEDRYMSSPFSRHWARNPRVLKRSLGLDDDLALIGPARRVRQRTTLHTSSSPYLGSTRQAIGSSKPLETHGLSPPSQSSQMAMKILETLEKLSPSPQGKFLEGPRLHESDKLSSLTKGKSVNEVGGVVGTPASNQGPDSSKYKEKWVQTPEFSLLPQKSTEAALGGTVRADTEAMNKVGDEFPSTSRSLLPALVKGFCMNAVFEESNSDDEAKGQKINLPPPTAEASNVAPPFKAKEEDVPTTAATMVATLRESPQRIFPNLTSSMSHLTPLEKGKPSVTSSTHETTNNLTSYPSFSFPSVQQVETKLRPPDTALPAQAFDVSTPFEKVSSDMAKSPSLSVFAAASHGPEPMPAVSAPVTLPMLASAVGTRETTAVVSVNTSRLPLAAPEMTQATPSFAKRSLGSMDVSWSPATSLTPSGTDLYDAENAVTMATESPVAEKLVEVDTMATEPMAEEAIITSSSPGLVTSSTSSFSFGGSVQPMSFSFVPGVATSSSLAAALSLGGQPGPVSASTSSVMQFTFGGAASTGQTASSFSFAGQTVTQASSFAAPTTFVAQLGTGSMGQLSSFGALPGMPFASSGNSSSPFGFGSSSPSNPVSFTASAPSGQPPTSLFGAPSMVSPFSSTASGNLSSTLAFSTSIAPASSAPPTFSLGATSSPFMIGAAAAQPNPFAANPFSSSSSAPNSSFEAPAIKATASNPFAANPFSSSSSAPTSSFEAPAIKTTASSTLFGSTALSTTPNGGSTTTGNPFSFGSGVASNPSPFTFGSGQSAAAQAPPAMAPFTFGGQASAANSSGQPFAFGGQQPAAAAPPAGNPFSTTPGPPVGNPFSASSAPPAANPFSAGSAPAANPFSTAGAPQPGSGFTPGASGAGDKSGRKFIKAKRIGGAKRSK